MIGWVLRHMAGAGLWETYAELGEVAWVVARAMGWTRREIDQAVAIVLIGLAVYALDTHHAEVWLYGGGGGAVLLLERTRLVTWWHTFRGPTPSVSTCEDSSSPHVDTDTDTDAVRQVEDVARRAVDRSMRNTRDTPPRLP